MTRTPPKTHPLDQVDTLYSPGHRRLLEDTGKAMLETGRQGAYTSDHNGRAYLDAISGYGIHNLGRRPPEVVAELSRAMQETDQGNFPMISIEKADLARELAAFTPGDLTNALFSVVRGEAMDAACKIARGYAMKPGIASFAGACHGDTGFALSLSDLPARGAYGPLIPETHRIASFDMDAVKRLDPATLAAIVMEPMQVENHCRKPGDGFFAALETYCRRNRILLVADETQTGFGRMGEAAFAVQALGLEPDILVTGEALGAGVFPIAATMFTTEVNTFLNDHPLIHLSTFGGSDLGCRVACRALESYRTTKPWQNAAVRGRQLAAGIQRLKDQHPGVVREVAGQGLAVSVAFDGDDSARAFVRECSRQGLLAAQGRVAGYSVLLRPSLRITEEETDQMLLALAKAVQALATTGAA